MKASNTQSKSQSQAKRDGAPSSRSSSTLSLVAKRGREDCITSIPSSAAASNHYESTSTELTNPNPGHGINFEGCKAGVEKSKADHASRVETTISGHVEKEKLYSIADKPNVSSLASEDVCFRRGEFSREDVVGKVFSIRKQISSIVKPHGRVFPEISRGSTIHVSPSLDCIARGTSTTKRQQTKKLNHNITERNDDNRDGKIRGSTSQGSITYSSKNHESILQGSIIQGSTSYQSSRLEHAVPSMLPAQWHQINTNEPKADLILNSRPTREILSRTNTHPSRQQSQLDKKKVVSFKTCSERLDYDTIQTSPTKPQPSNSISTKASDYRNGSDSSTCVYNKQSSRKSTLYQSKLVAAMSNSGEDIKHQHRSEENNTRELSIKGIHKPDMCLSICQVDPSRDYVVIKSWPKKKFKRRATEKSNSAECLDVGFIDPSFESPADEEKHKKIEKHKSRHRSSFLRRTTRLDNFDRDALIKEPRISTTSKVNSPSRPKRYRSSSKARKPSNKEHLKRMMPNKHSNPNPTRRNAVLCYKTNKQHLTETSKKFNSKSTAFSDRNHSDVNVNCMAGKASPTETRPPKPGDCYGHYGRNTSRNCLAEELEKSKMVLAEVGEYPDSMDRYVPREMITVGTSDMEVLVVLSPSPSDIISVLSGQTAAPPARAPRRRFTKHSLTDGTSFLSHKPYRPDEDEPIMVVKAKGRHSEYKEKTTGGKSQPIKQGKTIGSVSPGTSGLAVEQTEKGGKLHPSDLGRQPSRAVTKSSSSMKGREVKIGALSSGTTEQEGQEDVTPEQVVYGKKKPFKKVSKTVQKVSTMGRQISPSGPQSPSTPGEDGAADDADFELLLSSSADQLFPPTEAPTLSDESDKPSPMPGAAIRSSTHSLWKSSINKVLLFHRRKSGEAEEEQQKQETVQEVTSRKKYEKVDPVLARVAKRLQAMWNTSKLGVEQEKPRRGSKCYAGRWDDNPPQQIVQELIEEDKADQTADGSKEQKKQPMEWRKLQDVVMIVSSLQGPAKPGTDSRSESKERKIDKKASSSTKKEKEHKEDDDLDVGKTGKKKTKSKKREVEEADTRKEMKVLLRPSEIDKIMEENVPLTDDEYLKVRDKAYEKITSGEADQMMQKSLAKLEENSQELVQAEAQERYKAGELNDYIAERIEAARSDNMIRITFDAAEKFDNGELEDYMAESLNVFKMKALKSSTNIRVHADAGNEEAANYINEIVEKMKEDALDLVMSEALAKYKANEFNSYTGKDVDDLFAANIDKIKEQVAAMFEFETDPAALFEDLEKCKMFKVEKILEEAKSQIVQGALESYKADALSKLEPDFLAEATAEAIKKAQKDAIDRIKNEAIDRLRAEVLDKIKADAMDFLRNIKEQQEVDAQRVERQRPVILPDAAMEEKERQKRQKLKEHMSHENLQEMSRINEEKPDRESLEIPSIDVLQLEKELQMIQSSRTEEKLLEKSKKEFEMYKFFEKLSNEDKISLAVTKEIQEARNEVWPQVDTMGKPDKTDKFEKPEKLDKSERRDSLRTKPEVPTSVKGRKDSKLSDARPSQELPERFKTPTEVSVKPSHDLADRLKSITDAALRHSTELELAERLKSAQDASLKLSQDLIDRLKSAPDAVVKPGTPRTESPAKSLEGEAAERRKSHTESVSKNIQELMERLKTDLDTEEKIKTMRDLQKLLEKHEQDMIDLGKPDLINKYEDENIKISTQIKKEVEKLALQRTNSEMIMLSKKLSFDLPGQVRERRRRVSEREEREKYKKKRREIRDDESDEEDDDEFDEFSSDFESSIEMSSSPPSTLSELEALHIPVKKSTAKALTLNVPPKRRKLPKVLKQKVPTEEEREAMRATFLSSLQRPVLPMVPPAKKRPGLPEFSGWDINTVLEPHRLDHLPTYLETVPTLIKAAKFKRTTEVASQIKLRPQCAIQHPRIEGENYASRFGLVDLFEFMLFNVIQHRPAKPLDYLIEMTRTIMTQMKIRYNMSNILNTQHLSDQSSFMTASSGLSYGLSSSSGASASASASSAGGSD